MTALEDGSGQSCFPRPAGDERRRRGARGLAHLRVERRDRIRRPGRRDFAPTPFSADEVLRIKARQAGNAWSYARAVRVADAGGARLVTTPTGMLMGAGGNAALRMCSQLGGTTWGDIFLINSVRATRARSSRRPSRRVAWCTAATGRCASAGCRSTACCTTRRSTPTSGRSGVRRDSRRPICRGAGSGLSGAGEPL